MSTLDEQIIEKVSTLSPADQWEVVRYMRGIAFENDQRRYLAYLSQIDKVREALRNGTSY